MAELGVNDALRFGLELAALGSLAFWGWSGHTGLLRVLLAVGLPLAAAAAWGVFRVPGDPGDAPVAVPGIVRLLLEGGLFAVAVWALADAGRPALAGAFAVLVGVHYVAARDRVRWLVDADR